MFFLIRSCRSSLEILLAVILLISFYNLNAFSPAGIDVTQSRPRNSSGGIYQASRFPSPVISESTDANLTFAISGSHRTANDNGFDYIQALIVVVLTCFIFFILFSISFTLGITAFIASIGWLIYDVIRYDADYAHLPIQIMTIFVGALFSWFKHRNTNILE